MAEPTHTARRFKTMKHRCPANKPCGQIVIFLLLAIGSAILILCVKHCSSDSFRSSRPNLGVDSVRVAIQYAPVTFYVDSDSLAGFDYALLKMTGLPAKIHPITSAEEGLRGLRDNRYDVLIADLPQLSDSSGEYIFTIPAYIDRQVLVQTINPRDSAGETITSVFQLADDTIFTTMNAPTIQRIHNIAREIGSPIHVVSLEMSAEKLLISQALGHISGPTVVNERVAQSLAKDYPQLDYSLQISFSQFQPWILRSNEQELCRQIDSLLDSIKQTPAYDALVRSL